MEQGLATSDSMGLSVRGQRHLEEGFGVDPKGTKTFGNLKM